MIRTLTYRDLTPAQRAKAAHDTRQKLLGLLNNPFLTAEQRNAVFAKMDRVGKWEKLQLDPPAIQVRFPPALPARTPQHHDVGVKDAVKLGEKVS